MSCERYAVSQSHLCCLIASAVNCRLQLVTVLRILVGNLSIIYGQICGHK